MDGSVTGRLFRMSEPAPTPQAMLVRFGLAGENPRRIRTVLGFSNEEAQPGSERSGASDPTIDTTSCHGHSCADCRIRK
jgi:hypothetical protein